MFVFENRPEWSDQTRAGALVTVDLLIASDPIKGHR